MAYTLAKQLSGLFCLFRRAGDDDFTSTSEAPEREEAEAAKIRCPHCDWTPPRSAQWTCWDCDFPEYFYNGCGTHWNTFETEGVCPTCQHKWAWTACLRCLAWSRHQDWYGSGVGNETKGLL